MWDKERVTMARQEQDKTRQDRAERTLQMVAQCKMKKGGEGEREEEDDVVGRESDRPPTRRGTGE